MRAYRKSHRHYHFLQYALLFLLMATSFFAFVESSGYPQKQMAVGAVAAVTYVIWGMLHHYCDQDFNWKIVIEYTSIAIFGILAFWVLYSYLN